MRAEIAAVLAALTLSCAPAPARAAPGRSLGPPGHAASDEEVWVTGSLRRTLEPYRDLWVVADVLQAYDLRAITRTSRRERVRYRPLVHDAFEIVEDRERPAGARHVDAAVSDLPGERFSGSVVEARASAPSARSSGSLVIELDNARKLLLPGMRVALAVQTDREPVLLTGVAELPPPPRL